MLCRIVTRQRALPSVLVMILAGRVHFFAAALKSKPFVRGSQRVRSQTPRMRCSSCCGRCVHLLNLTIPRQV